MASYFQNEVMDEAVVMWQQEKNSAMAKKKSFKYVGKDNIDFHLE